MTTSMSGESLDCVEKLKDAEGYPIWKFQMGIILETNNLYEVVTTRLAVESVTTEERTLVNLTARLLVEETRHKAANDEEQLTFKADEKRCFKCGKKGHVARSCRTKNENVSKGIKCFICIKSGHMAKDCKAKVKTGCKICKKQNHEEKDCFFRKKEKNENKEESNQVSFLIEDSDSKEWIIDSGTTSHMTNDKKKLKEMKKVYTEVGVAKKQGSMQAKGRGKIELRNCVLNDVLYVPDLKKNLLSVSAITQKGANVLFEEDRVLITKKDK
ncbi:copia protein, partial [Lasius niger]